MNIQRVTSIVGLFAFINFSLTAQETKDSALQNTNNHILSNSSLKSNQHLHFSMQEAQDSMNTDPLTALYELSLGSTMQYYYNNAEIVAYPAIYDATTNKYPLYIVDGMPVSSIEYLNPIDINSIDIVKNGSALALYGSKATNGLVIISTHKATAGTPTKLTTRFNTALAGSLFHNHDFNVTWSTKRSTYFSGISYSSNIKDEYSIRKYSAFVNSEHVLWKGKDRNIISVGENAMFGVRSNVPNFKAAVPPSLYYSMPNYIQKSSLRGSAYINISPLENLTFSSSFNSSSKSSEEVSLHGKNESFRNSINALFNIQNKHSLSLIAGHEWQKINAPGFLWDEMGRYYADGWNYWTSEYDAYFTQHELNKFSYELNSNSMFTGATLNISNKYIIDAVYRNEKLSTNNKRKTLPAISTAWILSNEKFLSKRNTIYTELHANWRMSDNRIWYSDHTSSILNIGSNVNLFSDKLQSTINWTYASPKMKPSSEIKDLFVEGILNKSNEIELMLKWQGGSKFRYSLAGHYSHNFNRPTVSEHRFTVNYAYSNYIWGYKVNGIFQNWQEVEEYKEELEKNREDNSSFLISDIAYIDSIIPGDYRFEDLNMDGVINVSDISIIGDKVPNQICKLQFNGSYKNISFHLLATGIFGNDAPHRNLPLYVTKLWEQGIKGYMVPSSALVEDGSYIKLKNLSIGYNLKGIMKENSKLTSLRITLSGQNLISLTSYAGYDPEIGTNVATQYEGESNTSPSNYPFAKSFMISISGEF